MLPRELHNAYDLAELKLRHFEMFVCHMHDFSCLIITGHIDVIICTHFTVS